MSTFWKDYFYYTKRERNGFFVLLSLCIFLFFLPKVYQIFFPPTPIDITFEYLEPISKKEDKNISNAELFIFDPNTANQEDFSKLGLQPKTVRTILNYRDKGGKFRIKNDFKKIYNLSEKDFLRLAPYIEFQQIAANVPKDVPRSYDNANYTPTPKPAEYFTFDPNTASQVDLLRLGLSERIVKTILNFRSKGRFRKASDLAKIFGLSESDYQQLYPYIEIQPLNPTNTSKQTAPASKKLPFDSIVQKKAPQKVRIDVNIAAREEWQLLSGIGAYYAKKIVEQRKRLGGFVDLKQVAEIIPDSTYQKILPQLQLETTTIQQLNINTASVDELKIHPYLKWQKAQIIVNYRKNHGHYSNVEDLSKIRAFDAAFIKKISPYLTVE